MCQLARIIVKMNYNTFESLKFSLVFCVYVLTNTVKRKRIIITE